MNPKRKHKEKYGNKATKSSQNSQSRRHADQTHKPTSEEFFVLLHRNQERDGNILVINPRSVGITRVPGG